MAVRPFLIFALSTLAVAVAPTTARATCSTGMSFVTLIRGDDTDQACTVVATRGPGTVTIAPGEPLAISGWYERCCHGMGQTDNLSPCTQESLNAWDLTLYRANPDDPDDVDVVPSDWVAGPTCDGRPSLRLVGELTPGEYHLDGPTVRFTIIVLDGVGTIGIDTSDHPDTSEGEATTQPTRDDP